MSSILFVRHAQASLFESDYDQLSDRGRQQASQLGRHLARQRLVFDEIYTGPCHRHRQTLELVAEQVDGLSPTAVEIAELDEHHVDELVTRHVEKIAEQFPDVRNLQAVFRSTVNLQERQESFARLFEAVADLWVANRCPLFGVESWSEFNKRVNNGIGKIVDRSGRGRRILVFTSAGAIVVALQRALSCPDPVALGLGWRIWDCSLTDFVFSGDRFSLSRFNAMPHLDDRDDWTYR